ncbi:hypothetical protein L288_14290 [Sphingobium quisquiliarum P25]|uniref:FAD-binding domain-containing protein n=1 Tax=Sphingobium quisquiliarum P25 TaxID=1329909 RepID=T0I3N4_9SPHN|nr:FAD-dependent monooxygenase [Sphingobium quisquiliarum]EQB04244.1 hypothetical protein L288_14290 [Sphingobium quisquiliarum P25]
MTSGWDAGRRLLVIGAGISGLTAAAAAGQRGWQVDVVERKPQVEDGGGVGLTLVGNAMRALASIGVAEQCVAAGMPADIMRMMHADGSFMLDNPLPRIGGPEWPGGTGIRRADFHAILVEAARQVARIRCATTMESWEDRGDKVDVRFNNGSRQDYELIVAADGLYSATRRALMPELEPKLTGQACWRVPVRRPAEVRCTHLFLGGRHGAVGICPVSEDQAYLYIVQSDDGGWRDPAALDRQMREELDGYGGLVAELAAQIVSPADVSFRPLEWLIAPKPWGRGRLVMIGDAVHANPPVLAQGAAMGIEDAVVLAEELDGAQGGIESALARFITRRYGRASHVVEASCQLARLETDAHEEVDVAAVMRSSAARLAEPV